MIHYIKEHNRLEYQALFSCCDKTSGKKGLFWLLVSEGWPVLCHHCWRPVLGQKISAVGMRGRGDWFPDGSHEIERKKNASELSGFLLPF